jgi:hypothetical protein
MKTILRDNVSLQETGELLSEYIGYPHYIINSSDTNKYNTIGSNLNKKLLKTNSGAQETNSKLMKPGG